MIEIDATKVQFIYYEVQTYVNLVIYMSKLYY